MWLNGFFSLKKYSLNLWIKVSPLLNIKLTHSVLKKLRKNLKLIAKFWVESLNNSSNLLLYHLQILVFKGFHILPNHVFWFKIQFALKPFITFRDITGEKSDSTFEAETDFLFINPIREVEKNSENLWKVVFKNKTNRVFNRVLKNLSKYSFTFFWINFWREVFNSSKFMSFLVVLYNSLKNIS